MVRFRTQISAFVEQRGDDFGGCAVDEARGGEHIEDTLALGAIQGPGGHFAGLPVPGSGPSATVEGGSGQAQRPARRRHADLHGQFGGGHQQSFPLSRFNPSSPATFPCTSMIVCAVASSFSSRVTFASSCRTLGLRGVEFGGFGAAFLRRQGLERAVAPRLAPHGQMRAVQAFAAQQPADLAGACATVGLIEDPQTVLGAELPPLRLGRDLRIGRSARQGAAGPGGLVATLLDLRGRRIGIPQNHRITTASHRRSPPPPYTNSKGSRCLNDIGR